MTDKFFFDDTNCLVAWYLHAVYSEEDEVVFVIFGVFFLFLFSAKVNWIRIWISKAIYVST